MASEVSEQVRLSDYRSITTLYIKTLVTVFFATATHVLLNQHLRRRNYPLLVILYPFIPTIPLIQLGASVINAFKHYFVHYNMDEPFPLVYYVLGSLGAHAQVDDTKYIPGVQNEGQSAALTRSIPILDTLPSVLVARRPKANLALVGRFLTVSFTLIQAIGAAVLYIRRTENSGRYFVSGLDHWIGWLAISSATCSLASLVALIARTDYIAEEKFLPEDHRVLTRTATWQIQFLDIGLGLFLHGILEDGILDENKETFRSIMALYQPIRAQMLALGAVTLLLRIFQKEARRLVSIPDIKYLLRFRKLKPLLLVAIILWVFLDVIWVFVLDMNQAADWWGELKECVKKNSPVADFAADLCNDYYIRWWKDPIEDSLVVI